MARRRPLVPGLTVGRTLEELDQCLSLGSSPGLDGRELNCDPVPDTLEKLYLMMFNLTWKRVSRQFDRDPTPEGIEQITEISGSPAFIDRVLPEMKMVNDLVQSVFDEGALESGAQMERLQMWNDVVNQLVAKIPYMAQNIANSIRVAQGRTRQRMDQKQQNPLPPIRCQYPPPPPQDANL